MMLLIPSIFWYWSGFCNFHFSNSAISIRRGSDVFPNLGLGPAMGEGKSLIASLGAGLGLCLKMGAGTGVGMDADNVGDLFSSCFNIFSWLLAFLAFAINLNSSTVKFDKLDIIC